MKDKLLITADIKHLLWLSYLDGYFTKVGYPSPLNKLEDNKDTKAIIALIKSIDPKDTNYYKLLEILCNLDLSSMDTYTSAKTLFKALYNHLANINGIH